MKPRDPAKDLIQLRDDYRLQVGRINSQARTGTPTEKRLLEMHARVLGSCEQDLDDLIKGKEHPSARRS